MRKTPFVLLTLGLLMVSSCKKDGKEELDETIYNTSEPYTLSDVSYGNDAKQSMDIYLPANRNAASTKVFVLVHGGGWLGGDKSAFDGTFNNFKQNYPNNAVINLNYRLGTIGSPGYPKQIHDIQNAIEEIQEEKYNLAQEYFFYGISAGGHLSLLYGYAFDPYNEVKAICNLVGPSDLTDTSYDDTFSQGFLFPALIGSVTEPQKTNLLNEVSPVNHISADSPPTLSVYGGADTLVPASQYSKLHDELDNYGIDNKGTVYPDKTHASWSQSNLNDFLINLGDFIATHF